MEKQLSNPEPVMPPEYERNAATEQTRCTHPQQAVLHPKFFVAIKVFIIGLLTLILMIPMFLIDNLINEREQIAREASLDVYHKWSGRQTLLGPVLTILFYESNEENGRNRKTEPSVLQILPETLEISGDIQTTELKRGLYEVVVYNAPIELKGCFVLPEEALQNNYVIDEAMVNIGISDLRGVSNQIKMQWGKQTLTFDPGVRHNPIISSGVTSRINIQSLIDNKTIAFSVRIELKGSESLQFAPFGKTTSIALSSNCRTPSFSGAFLPDNRQVDKHGFKCDWKIMYMNRNYPQVIKEDREHNIYASNFGVDMLIPVQHYQKSMRSVKYAILIILLTFVVSFFVELLQKKHIHPIQYLLIGLALCLFYSLLISISEHTSFDAAYAIASVMTVGLLTCYMFGILKIKKTAFTIGGLLALLYLYIFVLIQMETYALLAGSVGLFVILAVIMYFSQRINWNNRE